MDIVRQPLEHEFMQTCKPIRVANLARNYEIKNHSLIAVWSQLHAFDSRTLINFVDSSLPQRIDRNQQSNSSAQRDRSKCHQLIHIGIVGVL